MLAGTMAVVHFLGEELEERLTAYREQVVSLSAGVSITYIFMELMPEFHRIASETSQLIFVSPLLGFSSLHLVEKYLAKSGMEQHSLRKDYAEIHSAFLFLYYGAIGYLISTLVSGNTVSGLLFFLPILLHVAVSSFSVTELHETVSTNVLLKSGVSVAPLLGVAAHRLGTVSRTQFNPVFGAVTGMFFYVAIRDSIPRDDNGRPLEYVAGTVIYAALILAARSV